MGRQSRQLNNRNFSSGQIFNQVFGGAEEQDAEGSWKCHRWLCGDFYSYITKREPGGRQEQQGWGRSRTETRNKQDAGQ